MGYQTTYTLDTDISDRDVNEILSVLDKEKYNELFYAIDESGRTYNSSKWYEHEDDLLEISLLYEDVVFHLYGEGENAADVWHKYFCNGKIQRCCAKIEFDSFDPSKLVFQEVSK